MGRSRGRRAEVAVPRAAAPHPLADSPPFLRHLIDTLHAGRDAPDGTVSGAYILSMLAAMGPLRRHGDQVLENHGISDVYGADWYPLGPYLDALRGIGTLMGPYTLTRLGRQLPQHIPIPPGLDTLERALAFIGIHFDAQHRGVPPGSIAVEVQTDRRATMVMGTPYPCEYERGLVSGLILSVLHVRAEVELGPQPSRDDGAATSTYHVSIPVI